MLRCIERYGTAENFLVMFNPGRQREYTQNLRRVYFGEAPNLGVLAKAFGPNIPVAWLLAQIRDLSEYSGAKEKLDGDKARMLADVIIHNWAHLNVVELMLFFMRFKCGRYGHFYGSVDPMLITEAIYKFLEERSVEIERIEQEMRPEREMDAARERKKFELRLLEALKPWNMTPYEYFSIDHIFGLTIEDIEEIGWLYRL